MPYFKMDRQRAREREGERETCLVEGVFGLRLASDVSSAPLPADGVDLVDEENAGRVFPGHGEHVSNSGGTDADEHLEKLGPGNGNERDVGFSGRGLRQQGLAGSRRAFKGQKVVRLV